MLIRRARFDDVEEILRMLRAFTETPGFALSFQDKTARDFVRQLLGNPDSVGFVAEVESGRLCGLLGGLLVPWLLNSEERVAYELVWWVDEEFRGNGVAMPLIRGFEKWAREKGATYVSLACIQAIQGDRVAQLYERMKYTLSERAYVKEL